MMMRSMSQDSSVTGQRLKPGTARRVLGYARPYRGRIALFLLIVVTVALIVLAHRTSLRRYRVAMIAAYLLLMGAFIAWFALRPPPVNPDPNHTHADFAVFVDGAQLDFSGDEFMSGLSTDADHDDEVADARWFPLEDAIAHASYENERNVLRQAAGRCPRPGDQTTKTGREPRVAFAAGRTAAGTLSPFRATTPLSLIHI